MLLKFNPFGKKKKKITIRVYEVSKARYNNKMYSTFNIKKLNVKKRTTSLMKNSLN